MAIFRKIHTQFWRDDKVLEEYTPECKIFMVYILSNQNTTQIGIYKITKKQIAFELGYSVETINTLMDIFINKYKTIRYNEETRELAIKNWGKYNLDRTGKPMMDCINKELKEVKDKSLIKYVSESIPKKEIKDLFDMYSNDDSYHHTYNESYENIGQEKEEEKDKEEYKEEEVNDVGRYAKLYEENIGFVNQLVIKWLIYISENIDIELFKKAIEVAIDRGHVNKGYINGIINKWITNNIRSLKDLNAYEVSSKNKGDRKNGKNRYIKELEDEPIYQKPSEEQIREIQRLLQ